MSVIFILIICLLLLIHGSFLLDDVFGMTDFASEIEGRSALRGNVPAMRQTRFSPATPAALAREDGAFSGGGLRGLD